MASRREITIGNDQIRSCVREWVTDPTHEGERITCNDIAMKIIRRLDQQPATVTELAVSMKPAIYRALVKMKKLGYVRSIANRSFIILKTPVPEAMAIVVDMRKRLEIYLMCALAKMARGHHLGAGYLQPLEKCNATLRRCGDRLRTATMEERTEAAKAFHQADVDMHCCVAWLLGTEYAWAETNLRAQFSSMEIQHMREVYLMCSVDAVLGEHAGWLEAIQNGTDQAIAEAVGLHLEHTVQRNLEFRLRVAKEK